MNFDFALLHAGCSFGNLPSSNSNICSSFLRFIWVKKGSGTITFGEERQSISPDSLYFVPPLLGHSLHCTGPATLYYIYFTDRSMRIYDHFYQYQYRTEIPITPADAYVMNHIVEAVPQFRIADPTSLTTYDQQHTMQRAKEFLQLPASLKMELNGLLHVLLSHFMHKNAPRTSVSDMRVSQAVWQIDRDLQHVPSLEQMASEACLNKSSFIRLFRRQTGFTPTDYIIRRRMMRAQLLFVSGYRSVKEVANQLGYTDISYFGRTFKRIVGISPQLFIQQNSANI